MYRLMLLGLLWLGAIPLAGSQSFYSLDTGMESLGRGFESDLAMPLNMCLQGDVVFHGGRSGQLDYSGAFDARTMIDQLAGSVRGGVNLVIFGGSVKYSMRNKVTENSNSVGSVIRLYYDAGTYSLENRSLIPSVETLLKTNPQLARKRCGNSFIHSQSLGSNLYVSAKLHFRSKEEYEWYQTKIKVRFAFWSKTITKTKASQKAVQNAVYSIRVETDGGLTPRLMALTGGQTHYCKTDAMDDCYHLIQQLFQYLFDNGGYVNDLTPDLMNVVSYDVVSYEDSGHFDIAYAGNETYSKRYIQISKRLRAYQDMVNDQLENLQAFLAVSEDEEERYQLQQDINLRLEEQQVLGDAEKYCATLPGVVLCEQRVEQAIVLVH